MRLKAEYFDRSTGEVTATAVAETVADSCSLDNYLAQPDHTMDARIAAARETLGTDVVLLGHHYQRDEVIRFADYTGDSYKLLEGRLRDGREVHDLLRRALYGRDRRCARPSHGSR